MDPRDLDLLFLFGFVAIAIFSGAAWMLLLAPLIGFNWPLFAVATLLTLLVLLFLSLE
jgi:hypothetical protein